MKVKVAQSCPTLCDLMDYTVHGIFQSRILEQVTFPFSRGIFPTQGSNPGLPHCRRILYQLSHKGSPNMGSLSLLQQFFSYLYFALFLCSNNSVTFILFKLYLRI